MSDDDISDVKVDPSIASTGAEKFDAGERLFKPRAGKGKPDGTGAESKAAINPALLSYPFEELFRFADHVRQTEHVHIDGTGIWELTPQQAEYFRMLMAEIASWMKDIRYLRLAIAVGGIAVVVMSKGKEDVDYHRANPHLAPTKDKSNPTSPSGRKGARK